MYADGPENVPELTSLGELVNDLINRLQSNRTAMSKLNTQIDKVSVNEREKTKKLKESGFDEEFLSLINEIDGDNDLNKKRLSDDVTHKQFLDDNVSTPSKKKTKEDIEDWRKHIQEQDNAESLSFPSESVISQNLKNNEEDKLKKKPKDQQEESLQNEDSKNGKDEEDEEDEEGDEDDGDDDKEPSEQDKDDTAELENATSSKYLNEAEISKQNLNLHIELQRLEVIESKINQLLNRYEVSMRNVCDGAKTYLKEYSPASQSLILSYAVRLQEERMLQWKLADTKKAMLQELDNLLRLAKQASNIMDKDISERLNRKKINPMDFMTVNSSLWKSKACARENTQDSNISTESQGANESGRFNNSSDDDDQSSLKSPMPSLITYTSSLSLK